MICKTNHHHTDPYEALRYILRPDKVARLADGGKAIDAVYLASSDPTPANFARQFDDTRKMWGKGTNPGEVSYFHVKLSPNRTDNATPDVLRECAYDVARELFPGCEAVIAVHGDTKTLHAHIVVNSVSCMDGKHVHYGIANDYGHKEIHDRIDAAQRIGQAYGFSWTDTASAQQRTNAVERAMEKRMQESQRQWVKDVIDYAKSWATDQPSYIALVRKCGIDVLHSDKDYKDFTYVIPGWTRPCRGATLIGEAYGKAAIERCYFENAYKQYRADNKYSDHPAAKVVKKDVYIQRLVERKNPLDVSPADLIDSHDTSRPVPEKSEPVTRAESPEIASAESAQRPLEGAERIYMRQAPVRGHLEPEKAEPVDGREKPVEARTDEIRPEGVEGREKPVEARTDEIRPEGVEGREKPVEARREPSGPVRGAWLVDTKKYPQTEFKSGPWDGKIMVNLERKTGDVYFSTRGGKTFATLEFEDEEPTFDFDVMFSEDEEMAVRSFVEMRNKATAEHDERHKTPAEDPETPQKIRSRYYPK